MVTFLLTDIQGSTRLWEREPEAMARALARHDAVVASCVRRLRGHVVKSKGEGDSAFAVFPHARDAVAAALVIQCALRLERWATSTPIRVRMAIHTGRVDLRDGDYYGPTVNRCARVRALARGGQVLLSGVAAQLVQARLPAGASLADLGSHALKDLSAPEHIFQLVHAQIADSEEQATSDAPGSASRTASPPSGRAYKLADHADRDNEGRVWSSGVRLAGGSTGIRCYASPHLAALLNPVHERFRFPRLWEVAVDAEPDEVEGTLTYQSATAVRQVALPTVTAEDHARFAVLCARAALSNGDEPAEFAEWAESWLGGMDRSGVGARAVADALETEAHRRTGLAQPRLLMAANAARAAMHAAKMAWAAGRARDEEHTRAMKLSGEAVHFALRLAQVPVAELAQQALPEGQPRAAVDVPQAGSTSRNRILTALPA